MVRASLHGLTRAAITRAQGGKFSAGFWSGLASSALAPLASNASTFEGKIAMSAIVGGTASELGGGKFANGAVSAAFVHMYNHMAHKMPHKRMHAVDNPKAWDLNGDGQLSLSEANNWYRKGNGNAIHLDASKFTVLDLENRDIVLGLDYFVHGQVSLSKSGSIIHSPYDFDIKIKSDFFSGLRNGATVLGQIEAGQGQKFEIYYDNKPNIWKW